MIVLSNIVKVERGNANLFAIFSEAHPVLSKYSKSREENGNLFTVFPRRIILFKYSDILAEIGKVERNRESLLLKIAEAHPWICLFLPKPVRFDRTFQIYSFASLSHNPRPLFSLRLFAEVSAALAGIGGFFVSLSAVQANFRASPGLLHTFLLIGN